MASLALGIVGAGIGSVFGNPLMGFSLGMSLGGVLFPPRQDAQERGRMDDMRVTGSGYGAMIPQAFGSVRVGGNIIWLSHYLDGVAVPSNTENAVNLLEHVTSETQGGKGMPSATINNYTYSACLAVSVCRGPITQVNKIWAEDVVIYDRTATPQTKYDITFYLGDEAQVADTLIETFEGAGNVPAYRGTAYVVFTDFLLSEWGNRLPSLNFDIEAPGETVGEILADYAAQVGLAPADIVFDSDRTEVDGFVLAQRTEAKAAVEPLLRVFAIDMAEIGGKLVTSKRGCPSVSTIDPLDLGARIDNGEIREPPPLLDTKRGQDLELPGRLDLTYFSAARNYEQAVQGSVRHTKGLVQEAVTVNTPIVLTDDDARQAAERLLYTQWLERVDYQFALPPKYLYLAPGSPVLLPVNAEEVRCRITGMDIGLFGELRFSAVEDDIAAGILTQTVAGGETDLSSPSVLKVIPTTFDVYSGLEFRDEDGLHPGFYVAATGPTGWRGASIYYSSDAGVNWTFGGTVRDRSAFGETTSVLADGVTPEVFDAVNDVDVALVVTGTLETTSEADVVAGNNSALVGLEILGYATATLTGTLAYTLSDLYRGRRGSVMTGHASGERFWHLTPALVRVKVPVELIGEEVCVKCVSPGETLADVTEQCVIIAANNYPYALPGDLLAADEEGEFLVSLDGVTFSPVFLVTDVDNGIILDSEGNPVVSRPGY